MQARGAVLADGGRGERALLNFRMRGQKGDRAKRDDELEPEQLQRRRGRDRG